jgi:ABC-type transport system involved in multi-copper enzyme maturation permease subunit
MNSVSVIARELLVFSRRKRPYSTRIVMAIALLAAFWMIFQGHKWVIGDVLTVSQVAAFARTTFYIFGVLLALLTLATVPEFMASAVAIEKERKTLSSLLITHLSALDIVAGKFVARFVMYLYSTFVCVPVFLLLCVLGGIPPLEIVYVYCGTISTAFFVAGLAMLISTWARTSRKAISFTSSLIVLWLVGTFVLNIIGFLFLPRWVLNWLRPFLRWSNASSPMFMVPQLIMSLARRGGPPAGSFASQFTDMITLQVSFATACVLLAIWRLRPAFRHQEGGDGRTLGVRLRSWNWRILPRKAVGEDPVFWREAFTGGQQGIAKFFTVCMIWGLSAAFVYTLWRFAAPAVRSILAEGYLASMDSIARRELNMFLRIASAWIVGVWVVAVAGIGATSIPGERARDTWNGLIMTPLSGREILRAKALAAIYRCWPWFAAELLLCVVGLAAGGLEPVSLLTAAALAIVLTAFASALGVWCSLSVEVAGNASGTAIGLLICVAVIPPLIGINENLRTVFNFATCVPYLISITMLSPLQVSWLQRGDSAMVIQDLAAPGGARFGQFVVTVVIGFLFYLISAVALFEHACARFDNAIDRPRRARPLRERAARPARPEPAFDQELVSTGAGTIG